MTVFSELRMRPATAERWGWDASVTARLVMAGVVIFTLLVGANLATPLYPLLQAKLGITALDITVAFSAYVLALVATLILAGHWSDHIGRRAALVLAVLVGLAGGFVFATADGMLALCAGRALQGRRWRWPPAQVPLPCASCCPAGRSGPRGSRCWPPPAAWRPGRPSAGCSPSFRDPPPRRITCTRSSCSRCWCRFTCSRRGPPSPRSRVRSR